MIQLSLSHVAGLITTISFVVGSGVFSARSVKSAAGYSLDGRSAGAALIAGGISGTAVGGSATIGTAQMAASFGLSAWWFTLGTGLALLVLATVYALPLRRSKLETIPQFLSIAYGRGAGPIASIVSSLGILFSAVASALSGIHLIAMVFALPPWSAAVIIVVLVLAYVVFGGMRGAGVAGLLRMIILGATLLLAGVAAASSLAGMPDMEAVFPPFPWWSLWGRGVTESLGNLLSLVVGVVCTQTYVQAIYSASDARVAAIGTGVAALITIPVGLPSIAIGMFMHAQHPDLAPVLALPMFLVGYLPGWIAGVGLAAILLSVVGSIAGLALGIGTMAANDIGRRLLGIRADSAVLLFNRLGVLVVTCLSVTIALASLDSYVLEWNFLSMALRGAGIFLPLTLAIFRPGLLSGPLAQASIVVSTVLAVLWRLLVDSPLNPLFVGLAASLSVVALALVMRSVSAMRR